MLERFGRPIQFAWVAAMLIASVWAFSQLPAGATVPVHFNAYGQADGWAGAPLGLFLLPALALGHLALQWLLPRVDPRGHNLRNSGKAVSTIWVAVTLLLAVVHAQLIAMALGLAVVAASASVIKSYWLWRRQQPGT
jgi:uncharacterized membrane protein